MARRAKLHDVELLDEDPGDGAPPPDAPDAAPDGRRRRRLLVVGAAVLAVLVAVGVTGQVLLERREDARLAAVAAHPGSMPPLDGPPTPLWEVDSDTFTAAAQVRTADGLLLGVRDSAEGPVVAAALDGATGREVWRVELLDGSTRPALEPGYRAHPDSGACTALDADDHLAVCLAHDGFSAFGAQALTFVPPVTSRVVVLDTRDGTVVTDLTASLAPDGLASSVTVLDDLVVAVVETPDGAVVRASDPDGTVRWSTTAGTTDAEPWSTGVDRVADLVAVLGDTEVALVDEDGTTVRTHRLAGGHAVVQVDGVHVRPDGESSDAATAIVRPEGVVEVQGFVLVPLVDDGSAPGLTITSDGVRLAGWVDGERRWTSDDSGSWNLLVLGGQVVLDDGQGVTALDARTGAEVWRSEAVRWLPMTDGRVLLGVARIAERGVETQMVALDPADGTELWRAPLPDGTTDLSAYRGLLVAVQDDGGLSRLTVLG